MKHSKLLTLLLVVLALVVVPTVAADPPAFDDHDSVWTSWLGDLVFEFLNQIANWVAESFNMAAENDSAPGSSLTVNDPSLPPPTESAGGIIVPIG